MTTLNGSDARGNPLPGNDTQTQFNQYYANGRIVAQSVLESDGTRQYVVSNVLYREYDVLGAPGVRDRHRNEKTSNPSPAAR